MHREPRAPSEGGEQALVESATALLRAGSHDIAHAIAESLHRASEALGAKGSVLFRFAPDGSFAEATHEWRAPGLPSLRGGRYLDTEVGETFAALQSGKVVEVRAGTPPVDYQGLRAVMADQGTTGAMLFPLRSGEAMSWILVFEWRDTVPTFEPWMVAFGERAAAVVHAGVDRERELAEHAETQARMLEHQKLESLGVMAGGIVHDFNNVLQAVLGLSEVLVEQLAPGPQRELADLIGAAARRAADLTHRFLIFSRQDVRHRQNIDVGESLRAALQLLRSSIPEDRQLRVTVGPDVGTIYMAPIDFEQAIVNLCNNASEAMPEGGTIDVDCHLAGEDGRWVRITVADDGAGMSPEELAKACDLFFTTKPPGEGTGLGLPMVKRTVESAGGRFAIESARGMGTTVRIELPASTKTDVPREEDEGPPVTGDETILVVEDDSFVRRVACTHLQKAGFSVIQASDGRRALELYRAHRDEIAAVLTDVIMPGLGGVALHEAIAREGPPPPFLFASGYDAGALSEGFLAGPDRDFISKPYPAQQMLRRIRRLIDARKKAPPEG